MLAFSFVRLGHQFVSRSSTHRIARIHHKPTHRQRRAIVAMSGKFQQPARTPRMKPFGGPSVWLEFSPLARITSALNLGQGAPGWSPPQFLTDALVRASQSIQPHTQYARSAGAPELVKELARFYSPRVIPSELKPREIDANTEVLITVGASQALNLAATVFLDAGDEALLIEPAFDMYTGVVQLAGATPKYIALKPVNGKLELDMDELSNALSERTKLMFLNSPHNPSGKVFSKEELKKIADILDEKAPSCIVVSDEVYEHIVYDTVHTPFASVSVSAFERTLSVYSAGKTFSATGLKTGWVIGNADLLRDMQLAQQFVVFCSNHLSQIALAEALKFAEQPFKGYNSYFEWLRGEYQKKRDFLVKAIRAAGMEPIVPDGAFYILARVPEGHEMRQKEGVPAQILEYVSTKGLQVDPATYDRSDYNISRNLVLERGVASIPNSAFISVDNVGKVEISNGYIRFAFCHPDEVLSSAAERIKQ